MRDAGVPHARAPHDQLRRLPRPTNRATIQGLNHAPTSDTAHELSKGYLHRRDVKSAGRVASLSRCRTGDAAAKKSSITSGGPCMRLEVAYGPGRNHTLVGTNSLRTRAGSDLSRAVAATVPVQPTGPSLPRLRLRYRSRHQVADGAGIDRRAVRAMLSRPTSLLIPARSAGLCWVGSAAPSDPTACQQRRFRSPIVVRGKGLSRGGIGLATQIGRDRHREATPCRGDRRSFTEVRGSVAGACQLQSRVVH